MKSDEEINDMLDRALDTEGSLPGMSYEDGVKAALEWVMNYTDEPPIEEE